MPELVRNRNSTSSILQSKNEPRATQKKGGLIREDAGGFGHMWNNAEDFQRSQFLQSKSRMKPAQVSLGHL